MRFKKAYVAIGSLSLGFMFIHSCKPRNSGVSQTRETPSAVSTSGAKIDEFAGFPAGKSQHFIVDKMLSRFAKDREDPTAGTNIPMAANPGKWTKLYYTPNMQAVHVNVLPSGKVLMVNGSSHRDRADGTKYFQEIDQVSNIALVDLREGKESFTPVKLPEKELKAIRDKDPTGSAVDLFCGGHNQLPNGNVLFASGTRQYDDGNFSFSGNKIAWQFDSAKGAFTQFSELREGHWYPTVTELGDGRMAVFSGIGEKRQEYGPGPNYPLAVSYLVEVYDMYKNRWDSFSIEGQPVQGRKGTNWTFPAFMGGSWDAYPRAALQRDGRVLFTGDGVYPGDRSNFNMFSAQFSRYGDPLKITLWGHEGVRKKADGHSSSADYPGMAIDPRNNDGNVLIVGGQLELNNLGEAENSDTATKRTTADITRINYKNVNNVTAQTFEKAFGDRGVPENQFRNRDGTMHSSVITLPTQQVLNVGGGNYGFRGPVFHPTLMTPDNSPLGFKVERMSPFKLPHLYHSSGVLLPDARVMIAGGNVHRGITENAAAPTNPGNTVPVDEEFQLADTANPYDEPGAGYSIRPRNTLGSEKIEDQVLPTEFHFVEVFEPPYLQTGAPRPTIASIATHKMNYKKPFELVVSTASADNINNTKVTLVKFGSITHGMDFAQRLIRLKVNKFEAGKLAKLMVSSPSDGNEAVPGYYMMFFVSSDGVPSVSKIVCLSRPEKEFSAACDHDFNQGS